MSSPVLQLVVLVLQYCCSLLVEEDAQLSTLPESFGRQTKLEQHPPSRERKVPQFEPLADWPVLESPDSRRTFPWVGQCPPRSAVSSQQAEDT